MVKTWTSLLSLVPFGFAAAAAAALPAAASAAPRAQSYTAALAAPVAEPRKEIVNGVLWKCAGDRCSAPSDGSRPVLACQRVARTFGAIVSFSGPAGDLSREDVDRCNSAG